MSGQLTNTQVDVATVIEQNFWEEGAIPTNDAVAERLGISVEAVATCWKNETFRIALAARGVSYDNRADKGVLTMDQLMAANALMNIHDRRSTREKCRDLNISPQQLSAWMRQPAFQDHLKRRANVLLDQAEPAAHRALVQAIDSGDLKAVQLLYEMRGIYNPRVTVDVNVEVTLRRVVEIVAKHVKDPVILTAIANDIEGLEGGTQMNELPAAPVGVVETPTPIQI